MAGDRSNESRRRLVNNLRSSLGQTIIAALQDPTVVEVMLNPNGKLFVERLGQRIDIAGQMSAADAEIVIGNVAHALKTEVTLERPIVSGELPPEGHRFEGILPPAAPAPAFTIRKRASMLIRLEKYVSDEIMTEHQVLVIREAISHQLNIVVSGGTGTGKTTLTNAILAELVEVAPDHRLVILEDTAEIQCTAENYVSLHTTGAIDMGRLLKSTMRLRPDRIIVGEVRDGAALTLLKAGNTGHPGGVTTVHSNSAFATLTRLEQLVAEVSTQPMPEVIGEAVDLIVSIERAPKGRVVREILRVDGFRDGAYQYEKIGNSQSDTMQGKLHVA